MFACLGKKRYKEIDISRIAIYYVVRPCCETMSSTYMEIQSRLHVENGILNIFFFFFLFFFLLLLLLLLFSSTRGFHVS